MHGKQQSNSGATLFNKGDITTNNWLYEAKTCIHDKQSFSIKQDWLTKIKQEAFSMNKEYYSLVFNFGRNQPNYYILDERIFTKILKILDEMS